MEFFHVLNRGVEKRPIFMDDHDRRRFVRGLWAFNDDRPIEQRELFGGKTPDFVNPDRTPLVDIHGWCLMHNHYHLLLSEKCEGGLTKFIRKLNIGYANYFNERHDRSGALFQGRTKKVHIARDAHLLYILHYIHLNPLDYRRGAQSWRAGKLTDIESVLKYLAAYPWSSYGDYTGKENSIPLLTTTFFKEFHGDYEQVLQRYLSDMEMETLQGLTLE